MNQPPFPPPGRPWPGPPPTGQQWLHSPQAVQPPGGPYAPHPGPQRKSNTPIWIALAALVALAGVVVTIILVNRDSGGTSGGGGGESTTAPNDAAEVVAVVEGFMDAVIDGDLTEAKSHLCPELASNIGTDLPEAGGISYDVHEPTIDGDSAEVIVDVYEDGDVDPGLLELDKTADGWKICGVGNAPSSAPAPTS